MECSSSSEKVPVALPEAGGHPQWVGSLEGAAGRRGEGAAVGEASGPREVAAEAVGTNLVARAEETEDRRGGRGAGGGRRAQQLPGAGGRGGTEEGVRNTTQDQVAVAADVPC